MREMDRQTNSRNMSDSRQTDRRAGVAETHPVEEGRKKGRKTMLGRRQEGGGQGRRSCKLEARSGGRGTGVSLLLAQRHGGMRPPSLWPFLQG